MKAIDFLFAPFLAQASLARLATNKKPDQKLIGFVLLGGGRGISRHKCLLFPGGGALKHFKPNYSQARN